MQVRKDLICEINRKMLLFLEIYGESRLLEMTDALECWVVPAPLHNWMTMPDMGLLVASCYNIKLAHWSLQQSFTFLPLYSAPTAIRKIIHMGYIDGDHYILLRMKNECTMPPIFPVWTRYYEEQAKEWNL